MAKRSVLGAIVVMLLIAGSLAGCGNAAGTVQEPPPSPIPTAALAPPAPASAPRPASATTGGAGHLSEDAFQLGKRIFETEAGEGVGCSFCHGADGKGKIGPNIRGNSPDDIRGALARVDAMGFLSLSQEKIEAVSVYLQWLATQP